MGMASAVFCSDVVLGFLFIDSRSLLLYGNYLVAANVPYTAMCGMRLESPHANAWHDVMWHDVAWSVVWCGVVWCDMESCGVVR